MHHFKCSCTLEASSQPWYRQGDKVAIGVAAVVAYAGVVALTGGFGIVAVPLAAVIAGGSVAYGGVGMGLAAYFLSPRKLLVTSYEGFLRMAVEEAATWAQSSVPDLNGHAVAALEKELVELGELSQQPSQLLNV
jgi:hypothetical protein